MGEPEDFTVVELGAGRGEMASAFSEWRYVPVEAASGEMPEEFRGVVFSNEFFDALPTDVAVYRGGVYRWERVALAGSGFTWQTGEEVDGAAVDYLERYCAAGEEGTRREINLDALAWVDRIAGALSEGYSLAIDYGYTRAEGVRFPGGTLMSYRQHRAYEDVLANPGERDITAHVNFTALIEHGEDRGLGAARLETLAQTLLRAGERDQFAAALEASGEAAALQRRLQLKTLLFGMGETFRVLEQTNEGSGKPERGA
jgi:SAM-dependent MidA family methyltransferase